MEISKTTLAAGCCSWDGSTLPPFPVGTPKVSVLKIVIPPYTKLPPHSHRMLNAGVVCRGKLTVVAASGVEKTFSDGDAIIEMVGKIHYGENRGEEPVELIMFYAGLPGTPLSDPAS